MAGKAHPLRRWSWTDPVYDVTFVLMRGPWKPALAWMDKTFDGVTEAHVGPESRAKCIYVEGSKGCAIVLWFGDARVDHKVIAHEAFHAAIRVLGDRHILPRDGDGEEAYAYWLGWLFEECRRRLDA